MPFATKSTKLDLGGRYLGMHELLAVHPNTKAAVVLDEGHPGAVGRHGFSERYIGLHWNAAQTSQSSVASVGIE